MEVLFDNQKQKVKFQGTVTDLLRKLRVMREEVIVKVNGKLVPETRPLDTNDKVEIIKVVFGG
jgi:thiamine biosynthesis protein ThiS